MGVSSRIGADLALLPDEAFAELCRSRPEDFTRRRNLPRESLVASVLARKGRTLAIELREIKREFGMADPISRPGYLKARLKLNPLALRELARGHAAGVYADGDYRTYKGMVVVAPGHGRRSSGVTARLGGQAVTPLAAGGGTLPCRPMRPSGRCVPSAW